MGKACRCQPRHDEGVGGGGGREGEISEHGWFPHPRLRPSQRLQRVGAPYHRRSILASPKHAAAFHDTSASALGPSPLSNVRVGKVWWLLGPRAFFPVWFLEEAGNSLQRLFTVSNLKEIKSIEDLTNFLADILGVLFITL